MLSVIALATITGCLFIYSIFLSSIFSSYRHLPKPKQAPLLLRLLHEPTTFELQRWMSDVPNDGLIRYFGFLNQERLMVTTLEGLKDLLLKEAYTFDKSSRLSAIQAPAGVSGLVSAKGLLHKVHRRHTIAAYQAPWARTLYPTVWNSARAATDCLATRASEMPDRVVKVNRFLREACLETVGQAAFSIDLEVWARPQEKMTSQYLQAFDTGEKAPMFLKLLQMCPVPLQLRIAMMVSRLIGVDVSIMKSRIQTTLRSKLEAAKAANFEKDPSPEDAQGDLIDAICRRAGPHLSEKAIFRHALTTLAGSVEMASNQLAWAIYALSLPKNRHVQDSLRAEIRSHFPSRPDTISWEEARTLSYLTGVVNETFRLFPSVAHRFRICNTPTTLLNQPIRRGTMIIWPIYAINRSPSLWGDDADEFRPERWGLDTGTNTQNSRRDAYAFMTFGQGPRKCPGEHYTRVVMACMLLDLVGRFRFSMSSAHGDVFEDNGREKVKFGIVMKAPICAVVEEVPGWIQGSDVSS